MFKFFQKILHQKSHQGARAVSLMASITIAIYSLAWMMASRTRKRAWSSFASTKQAESVKSGSPLTSWRMFRMSRKNSAGSSKISRRSISRILPGDILNVRHQEQKERSNLLRPMPSPFSCIWQPRTCWMPFRAPPQGWQSPAPGREIPAGGNQHLCSTDEFPWTAGAHQEQGLYPNPGSSRALPLYEERRLRGTQGTGHPVSAQPIQSPRPVWRAGAEAVPPASEMADVRFRRHRSPSPNLGRTGFIIDACSPHELF